MKTVKWSEGMKLVGYTSGDDQVRGYNREEIEENMREVNRLKRDVKCLEDDSKLWNSSYHIVLKELNTLKGILAP